MRKLVLVMIRRRPPGLPYGRVMRVDKRHAVRPDLILTPRCDLIVCRCALAYQCTIHIKVGSNCTRIPLISEIYLLMTMARGARDGVMSGGTTTRKKSVREFRRKRTLPRGCALTKTPAMTTGVKWWARVVSNHRPLECGSSALPLSYAPI